MIPFEEQDILDKLLYRAEIREKINRGDDKPDRIAITCREAYEEIKRLRSLLNEKDRVLNV